MVKDIEYLITVSTAFAVAYMPYELMSEYGGNIAEASIKRREMLESLPLNELLKEIKCVLEDDIEADMGTLQEAWDNVVIGMLKEEVIKVLGVNSSICVTRGTMGKTNWNIKVVHNEVNFSHFLIQHGDLLKTITATMGSIVEKLSETKDIEERASLWEIYCLLNLYEYRWKYIWS